MTVLAVGRAEAQEAACSEGFRAERAGLPEGGAAEEMSQACFAGGRGVPPYVNNSGGGLPYEQLEVLLQLQSEAEAEWQQVRSGPRSRAAGAKFRPTLRGREHKDEEEGASILREALAEGSASAELESHLEHFSSSGLEGFAFERDWQVTEFQAAAVRADGEGKEQHQAVARRGGGGGPAEDAEACAADFQAAFRGEKEALQRRLLQDFRTGHSPIRRQVARSEMEVLTTSQHGAAQGEEFDAEQSKALKLAQDRELASTKVTRQEEEILRRHAEPDKLRYQVARTAGIGENGLPTVASRRSCDEEGFSAAHSEQAEGQISGLGAPRRLICFERDWRVTELPPTVATMDAVEATRSISKDRAGEVPKALAQEGAAFEGKIEELRSSLLKQPPKQPLSQHEVRALQQFLSAANDAAAAGARSGDQGLAVARQTVEKDAGGAPGARSPARLAAAQRPPSPQQQQQVGSGAGGGQPAGQPEAEGLLRARLAAATGGVAA